MNRTYLFCSNVFILLEHIYSTRTYLFYSNMFILLEHLHSTRAKGRTFKTARSPFGFLLGLSNKGSTRTYLFYSNIFILLEHLYSIVRLSVRIPEAASQGRSSGGGRTPQLSCVHSGAGILKSTGRRG